MSEIRNRVLREIFFAPTVVLPIVAGMSAWLLSWAADGVPALTVAGLVGVLGGLGWMATRAIFQTEKITHATAEKLRLQAILRERQELDRLDELLSQDRDDRDQNMLRLLRALRAQFEEFAGQEGIAIRSQEILGTARKLYVASVNNLHESYVYLQRAQKATFPEQRLLLDRREELLKEIEESVNHLHVSLQEFTKLSKAEVASDLSRLREELDANLRIAKKTEERLRSWESNEVPSADFLKE